MRPKLLLAALTWSILVLLVACDGGGADGGEAEDTAEVRDAASEVADTEGGGPEVADAEDAGPEVPRYPLDDVLRVNHIQFKGTHNSYHLEPDSSTAIPAEWAYSHAPLEVQLAEQGVRQVELDLHLQADLETFRVFHLPEVDEETTCETFRVCMAEVKGWSDAHPDHHLMWIFVEPKDAFDPQKIAGHYDAIDAAILDVWPTERLLVPDDVRGEHPSLRAALEADGWPTLGATRGRVAFLMLDSGAHRDGYLELHPNLEGAIIFARGGRGEPWSSFLELGNPVGSAEAIRSGVEAGYMVRTSADDLEHTPEDNDEMAAAALATGAHVLNVDLAGPEAGDWWFTIPDGTPSRCNPLTAPPECTPEDVESLGP